MDSLPSGHGGSCEAVAASRRPPPAAHCRAHLACLQWLGWRRKVKAPRSLGGHFRNAADHRDFAAIGTAAGVATAFAAPIGEALHADGVESFPAIAERR